MIVEIAVVLFTLVGVAFIWRRDDLAKAQSVVAGGTLPAGCVVAEGVIFFLMAIAALVLHRLGWIG